MSDACETANVHGHHSYFRKDFQMLLADEIYPPHRALSEI